MTEPTPNLPATRADLMHSGAAPWRSEDHEALERAVKALEQNNMASRLAMFIGRQLGSLSRFLPPGVSKLVDTSAEKAIEGAMWVALRSIGDKPPRDTRRFHKAVAAMSGAAGGVFGLASLPVELPVSTVIILRSIADIARKEGEDLSTPEVAFECLKVFALGAHENVDRLATDPDSKAPGVTESGYFATRAVLAKTVSEASHYVLAQGLGDEAAPILVRLVSQIASRFGLVVSEKLAAQAVPFIGAAGGAAVNYAFAQHFQSIAQAHFTVRRLERAYGPRMVKAEYDRARGAL